MKLTANVNVFFKVLKSKNGLQLAQKEYTVKTSKSDLLLLRKLEKLQLISDLKEVDASKNLYTYKVKNLRELHVYRNPCVYINKKNYAKITNKFIRNDSLADLLVSVSNPNGDNILTLKELKELNIGGPIICKIIKEK